VTGADSLLHGASSAPAVINGANGEIHTYADLATFVAARREELFGADGGAGQPRRLVWLYARNDLESLVSYLAAVEADQPVALVDPALPAETCDDLEAAYRPEIVIGRAAGIVRRVSSESSDAAPAGSLHDRLGLLLLTSGSTGSPKAVRISGAALRANADGIGAALRLDESTRAATTLPPFYSYGLSVLNSVLRAGGSLLVTDAGLLEPRLWQQVDEHGVTTLAGVPQSYAMLRRLRFLDRVPRSLRAMTAAGGRLPDDVVAEFSAGLAAAGAELFVMYGQTEATARISVLDPAALPEKIGSVGRALPGGRIEIDPATGEVIYHGPNVMLGYATSRVDLGRGDDLHGVLATGDLGRLDADGDLWLSGRSKRIAKIAGVRLGLDDVEVLLGKALAAGSSPETVGAEPEVAATAADDRLLLWYAGPDAALDRRRVVADLARRLRVPATLLTLHTCDALPRTPSGKIAYADLKAAA
jgi:acyl-CoA synthetase (AMP-forming)/AMP-acid ligase II